MCAMSSPKPAERMLLFTDAVVAIAITLLVLPLLDPIKEAVTDQVPPIDLVWENFSSIAAFLLSFAVIARLWLVHHEMFEKVGTLTTPLVVLNLAWLLTIVFLPFPTEMVGVFKTDRFLAAFYIGTILASSIFQSAMSLLLYAQSRRTPGANNVTSQFVFGSVGSTIALVVAMALTPLGTSYYGLLLLPLVSPISWLYYRNRKQPA
jgi:uncharacterized membrane protein